MRWALEEGRLRGVPVNAVHAWQPPVASPLGDVGPVPGPMLDVPVVIEKAKEAAEELVERVVQEVADEASSVDVRPAAIEGSPASALVEAAEGADLLVVGSRGLGGFKGLVRRPGARAGLLPPGARAARARLGGGVVPGVWPVGMCGRGRARQPGWR